jgi:NADH-quinone oxidoreductase subunit G
MVELEIDGKPIEVPEGSTVMEAANRLGIYVPHFCFHRKLSIAANCRMCLVQVEKAPKPLPACATPVTKGMKVWTHSDSAVTAQKGVMEFLLINHPLDCPICDQGGECQLQDLAVGYGGSQSRFEEAKRVVSNKDLGPLISTDMTRCIHCTRCVRFGEEVAGIMELGMIGRGEHSEIITFVGRTVDSEVSGNAIDLCPVGALTSKPFRYSARTWELVRRPTISPHCGLGSNLTAHVKQNRVMRVVPLENDAINECWLSDKDRFSYEALNSEARLARPMVKQDGRWAEVEWPVALDAVVTGLRRIREAHGGSAIGALGSPHATLEELHLLAALMRGLGSENVDFRLRQLDFRGDGRRAGIPWLGMPVAELSTLDRVVLVGSTLRKDHPLFAVRLRGAARRGLQLGIVHAVDDDLQMPVAGRVVVAPDALVGALQGLLKAVHGAKGTPVPGDVDGAQATVAATELAQLLVSGQRAAVLFGNYAQHHPRSAELHRLGVRIADAAGARFGFLGEAANSVGGYVAGAVPRVAQGGLDARRMLDEPRKAWVLLGVEPEFDTSHQARALDAMRAAEFVVALTPYVTAATDYAHVMLPVAPFTETSGTFISTEGRVQHFAAVVKPLGDTRPAWKVLRVLGNMLGIDGFGFESSEEVRSAAIGNRDVATLLDNGIGDVGQREAPPTGVAAGALQRLAEVPIYQADAIVRRAPSLQATRDARAPVAWMNGTTLARAGIADGQPVRVTGESGTADLVAGRDDRLADGTVRIAASHPETVALGAVAAPVIVEASVVPARAAG